MSRKSKHRQQAQASVAADIGKMSNKDSAIHFVDREVEELEKEFDQITNSVRDSKNSSLHEDSQWSKIRGNFKVKGILSKNWSNRTVEAKENERL